MVVSSGPMDDTSKGSSRVESCMAMATMSGKTAVNTKGITDLTRSMVRERTPTQMVASTKVSGRTACSTVLVALSMPSQLMNVKVNGPLANSNSGSTNLIRQNNEEVSIQNGKVSLNTLQKQINSIFTKLSNI